MTPDDSDASDFLAGSTGELADRLHSAAIRLLRMLRREDDVTGITAPRLSALSVVVFGGPLTLGELARAEQVRPPTMSRIVQALEREGYLRRTPHPTDRRAVLLHATPSGEQVLWEGRRRRVRALARELEKLGREERMRLGDAVSDLETVLFK